MQANKSADTKPEQTLGRLMWGAGLRYRKHVRTLPGKPDFVLTRYKLAIFCDGEFWHGRDWEHHKADHKSNQAFWYAKIEGNIRRDQLTNERLRAMGWTVLRFWESDIRKSPTQCLAKIMNEISQQNAETSTIYLADVFDGKKFGVKFFGPHSLLPDGSVMPFADQMAVVSHYLHNRHHREEKYYKKTAKGLLEDFGKALREEQAGAEAAEAGIEYSFFPELFQVPFLPHEKTKFTFIDLFAGIGGFRMAMQDLGGRCVFSSEWDAQAQRTYMLNYGEVPFGDITKEETKQFIPDDFDILCAGFPCQAFSLAGKRLGFEETRGTLFFDVAEILRRKRPKAFFLENVKGLMIHNKGRTLKTILKVLREDLDYYVPDPQIVNAMDFGVPQHRERVYIVGFRKDTGVKNFAYPQPTDQSKTFADVKEEQVPSVKYYLSTQYVASLEAHKKRHEAKGHGFGYEIISDDQVANAIVVGGMGRERNLVIDKRLTDFTPVTKIKGEVNRDGLRRMTPREWARLQGFPDSFIIGVADASAYKQFGNSVAVPAIRETAREILKCLQIIKK